MKTAEEWLNEVGEAVGQDMFCGNPNLPGSRSENIIKQIQLDAWKDGIGEAIAKVLSHVSSRQALGYTSEAQALAMLFSELTTMAAQKKI